jgi:hypothetical protein
MTENDTQTEVNTKSIYILNQLLKSDQRAGEMFYPTPEVIESLKDET